MGAERGVERWDFYWSEERIFFKSEGHGFHLLQERSTTITSTIHANDP